MVRLRGEGGGKKNDRVGGGRAGGKKVVSREGEGGHTPERVMDGGQSHVFARLIAVSIFRRFSCVTHDNNGRRAGEWAGRGWGGGGGPASCHKQIRYLQRYYANCN